MTVNTTITSVGVKDALRVINSIDKKARRAITTEYKEIVQPLLDDGRRLVPGKAPLSGFERSWTPNGSQYQVLPYTGSKMSRPPRVPGSWQQSKQGRRQMGKWLAWQKGMNAYVSGKKPITVGSYTRNLAAFGVKWQGPAAVLFDTSGQSRTLQGARMVAALTARYGAPSRVMWRAWKTAGPDVQDEVQQLINRIMHQASEALR